MESASLSALASPIGLQSLQIEYDNLASAAIADKASIELVCQSDSMVLLQAVMFVTSLPVSASMTFISVPCDK